MGHGDGLDLAALAGEVGGPLALVVAEVVDVERAGLRDAEAVEPEEADQRVVSGRLVSTMRRTSANSVRVRPWVVEIRSTRGRRTLSIGSRSRTRR